MAGELRISMLGPLVVERDGQALAESGWRSRQERRLLTILLARRGRHTAAERLIEWLWPGAEPATALVTLRSAVSSLRRTLEPATPARASSRYILTRHGGYAWNNASGAWLDVDEFLALTGPVQSERRVANGERLAASPRSPVIGHPSLANLERALALYRGDYLEEEGDAPWALAERERLRERYALAVQALVDERDRQGDHAGAIVLAQRGLGHVPLYEPLWRALMRSQIRAGDAAGALQSYERYRQALDHELGAMPSPQTQALHAAILRGELPPVERSTFHLPRPAQPPDASGAQHTTFDVQRSTFDAQRSTVNGQRSTVPTLVGRSRELAQIRTWLAELHARCGGIVALVGEAGIGKSRLVAEAAREALAAGVQPIALRCAPLDRDLPFAPLGAALRPLIKAAPAEALRRLPASALAQVADLLPALRDRLPDLPALPLAPPDEHRNRLIDGLVELALQIATTLPLAIICDDAHWADEATLALIGRLARRTPRHAVLIVLAYRPEELADNPALHALLRTLGREMLLRPLLLGPLAEAEATELIATLGHVAPEQVAVLAPRLIAQAGGNPLFLTVAVQSLLERYEAPSLAPILPALDTGAPLPDPGGARPIRDLVLGRLERLPPPARELTEQLAVLGRPASLDLIEQLAGAAGLEAAQVLLDRQMLVEGNDDRLGFAHELVRAIIVAALASPRRRLLHRRAAQALATLHGDAPERAAEIAHHYGASGRGVDTELLRYATAAGDQARRTFAYRAALGHYSAALDAASRLATAPHEIIQRAFAGRLLTCEALLDWDGIAATADHYRRWAAQRPDAPPALVTARRLALLRALAGDLAGAAELSRQPAAANSQQSPVLADMLQRTALILSPPAQDEAAEERAKDEADDLHPASLILHPFTPASPPPGDPPSELLALLGPDEAALALFQVGWAALMQGLLPSAGACLLRAYELALETGQVAGAVVAALQIAHQHALAGAPAETERWLELSLATAARAQEAAWASIWPRIHQGFLWLLDDQLDRAQGRFVELAAQLEGLSAFQSHRAGVQVGLALVALERGDHPRATQLLSAALDIPQALYGFVYVAAQQALARLAALRGDLPAARARLGQALVYSARRRLLPEYARTAIEIARIERDFGDPAAPLAILRSAADLASGAGLVPLATAAAALLERLRERAA
ncbi:MAG TPA: AAA family ATPase [Roseiflexaceae bacterium]|nr:AAA family ATPase [Roseiflexaceae bacterium]